MYRVLSTSNDFGVVDEEPVNLLRQHDCEFQSMPVGKASEERMIELIEDLDVTATLEYKEEAKFIHITCNLLNLHFTHTLTV